MLKKPGSTFLVLLTFLTLGSFATTYTVINCNNTGLGSLRQAITDANNNAGTDTIEFNIPYADAGYTLESGVGFWRIKPASAFPIITDSVIIDGTTQTTNQGDTNSHGPEIEVNGSVLGASFTYFFDITASNCTLEALAINAPANSGVAGIKIDGGSSNEVVGCYIGIDAAGGTAKPNNTGVIIAGDGKDNVIGGSTAARRNVLSGNTSAGVRIEGSGTMNNQVIGNYIGTDRNGASAVGNGMGVWIRNSAHNNSIGGATAAERNVISGNGTWYGVFIQGTGVDNNEVIKNYIGASASGLAALPNAQHGVFISAGAQYNRITGNLISGNTACGISISFSNTNSNEVQGNQIGTDATGSAMLENGSHGVSLSEGKYNLIGGSVTAEGNVIAFNGGDGIYLSSSDADYNVILHNSIFKNSGLGIDLDPDGPTPNDSAGHSGPNQNKNYPVASSAVYDPSGGTTTLSGTSDASDLVDIFVADVDPTGYGEGRTYLQTTAANAGGVWSAVVTGVTTSDSITLTGRDSSLNTSEFSPVIGVVATTTTTTTTATTTTTPATTTTTVPGQTTTTTAAGETTSTTAATETTTTTVSGETTTTLAGATTTTTTSPTTVPGQTTTTTLPAEIIAPPAVTVTPPSEAPAGPLPATINFKIPAREEGKAKIYFFNSNLVLEYESEIDLTKGMTDWTMTAMTNLNKNFEPGAHTYVIKCGEQTISGSILITSGKQ